MDATSRTKWMDERSLLASQAGARKAPGKMGTWAQERLACCFSLANGSLVCMGVRDYEYKQEGGTPS